MNSQLNEFTHTKVNQGSVGVYCMCDKATDDSAKSRPI